MRLYPKSALINQQLRFAIFFLVLLITNLNSFANKKECTLNVDSSINKPGIITLLPIDIFQSFSKRNTLSVSDCSTATFYMHIVDISGRKIILRQVQGLLDGSFIAVADMVTASGGIDGIIIRMDNEGNILSQNILRINSQPVSLYDTKINLNGAFTLSGIVQNIANTVFVAQLSSTLSTNWVNTFSLSSQPVKLTLHLLDEEKYALAIQLNTQVTCVQLNSDGSVQWTQSVSSPGLVNLIGFATMIYGGNGLVTLNFRSGRFETEVTTISLSGAIVSTHIIGDGIIENKGLDIGSIDLRMSLLYISKSNTGNFNIARNILYNSSIVETQHVYQLSGNYDFTVSGAMDNAGDAIGVCTGANGKLLFIKHFASDQTSPEHIRQYNVPVGSSIAAIARSYDGGYLFGLNTVSNNELIFIKTDSIGILAGCGYQDVSGTSLETVNVPNTASVATYGSPLLTPVLGTSSLTIGNLNNSYDCTQHYCPPAPPDDTCQSTYYKKLVSNSYVDRIQNECLMRNDNMIFYTQRYDRVLEGNYRYQRGLKLFDEAGHFIKGVKLYEENEGSTIERLKQFDDSTVVLCSTTFLNNSYYFSLRLFSDDLSLIWSHSIKAPPDFQSLVSGFTLRDFHRDQEGNYYFTGYTDGVLGVNAKFIFVKIDGNGNPLWQKVYEIIGARNPDNLSMTSTNSSLIFLADLGTPGNVSMRIDKSTGQLLNTFSFTGSTAATIQELLEYSEGRIFYAGPTASSNFRMGILDTIGRPVKLKYMDEGFAIESGTVKDGKLYASFMSANYSGHFIFKADTALNIIFANHYSEWQIINGIKVSNTGSIYGSGNYSHGESLQYYDPFIKKYDSNGKLGLCNSTSINPTIIDIPINLGIPAFLPVPLGVFIADIGPAITLLPDSNGQQINASICSSNSNCNMIEISGPAYVCQPNIDYTFHYTTNPGCDITTQFVYDTSVIHVQNVTDTSLVVNFHNNGITWIHALLNTGCRLYQDSIQVQVQILNGGTLTLGNDQPLCPGDTITLHAGNLFNTYTWQDGSTDSTFEVVNGGQYYVAVTNGCGEVFTDTIRINQPIIPAPNIGSDTSVCKKDTIVISSAAGFINYLWSPATVIIGSGQQINVSPIQDEIIMLLATTVDGCKAYDTLKIFIKEATPVRLGNDSSFCSGDSITINAGNGYTQYTWNNGSNAPFINVSQPGLYWVSAIDNNKCIARDTLEVQNVYPLPNPDIGPEFNLCFAEQKILDPGLFSNYLWQDNSNSRYFTVTAPGLYVVTVTDANNCIGSDSIELRSIFSLPSGFLAATDSICTFQKIDIKTSSAFSEYLWSDGSAQPTLVVDHAGIYFLSVTDGYGCKGTDSITIFPKDCLSGLYIPNAFTPNGDGINDYFGVRIFGNVLSFKLELYNRYGERVFVSENYLKGWDGKYKGVVSDIGTYVWQCTFQLLGKFPVYRKGTVLLIR